MGRYDKYLHLDRPYKRIKKPMDPADRAKIFLPYAALSGFGDSVVETQRYREDSFSLETDRIEEINNTLLQLSNELSIGNHPEIQVLYYDTKSQLNKQIKGYIEEVNDMCKWQVKIHKKWQINFHNSMVNVIIPWG